MEKRQLRRDAFLAVFAAALSLTALFCFSLLKKDGAYAAVSVGGKVHSRYPLSENTTVEIATEYGHNTLKIENGKARITSADCPDGLCKHHACIYSKGESIVCLPNKLVVEIRYE